MAVHYINPGDEVRVRTNNNGNYNNSGNGNYNNSGKRIKNFDERNHKYRCGAEYSSNFTYTKRETGEQITKKMVKAWFVRQGILYSIVAFENEFSEQRESKNDKKYINMVFELRSKERGVIGRETGCYFFDSGCVYLRKLGVLINTKFKKNGAKGWAGWWSPNTNYV